MNDSPVHGVDSESSYFSTGLCTEIVVCTNDTSSSSSMKHGSSAVTAASVSSVVRSSTTVCNNVVVLNSIDNEAGNPAKNKRGGAGSLSDAKGIG